ncbi:glycosyltransferase [Amycolatopsis pithecellobii]|uniref:Erythromycin biosynthesis protein CIII-like C-terminal domain-containing protein n=1 Tax=Amycolatopsis pithecellobii TaxID=664692 RepID=A0A6N7YYW7_9PSEU|nr:glycosyltransferase [Amycolatopsis pithecellobii]MTD58275.1 hypothetical protein [Amycolatopsis pithecellobii]
MRILFSVVPASGHVLPLLPLADAARRAGHDVAFLSGRGAAEMVPGFDVFEVGPSVEEAMAKTAQRLSGDDGAQPGLGAIEMFGGVRMEGYGDEAVRVSGEFAPDLVVHDVVDVVGPLVAAVLEVPMVEHRISGPLPAELLGAVADRALTGYASFGAVRPVPFAVVDPFPDVLLDEAERDHAPGRVALRPQPHSSGPSVKLPELPGPVALVTLGTSVREPEALAALVTSVAEAGASVLVTVADLDVPDSVRERVRAIGFVPLAQLLPVADVVVSAGGSGTVLAALAAGKPLVIRPFLADQPWNAERMARLGLAVAIEDPATAGEAVRKALDDENYRRTAMAVATELARLPDADQVLRQLLGRMPQG